MDVLFVIILSINLINCYIIIHNVRETAGIFEGVHSLKQGGFF